MRYQHDKSSHNPAFQEFAMDVCTVIPDSHKEVSHWTYMNNSSGIANSVTHYYDCMDVIHLIYSLYRNTLTVKNELVQY